MQKQTAGFPALVLIFLVSVSSFAAFKPAFNSSDPFYVGVTYCGDSVEEAKLLIDKVKNYTNLFVLQSGTFLSNVKAIEEIGDYAVNSGLNIILYCGGAFTANQLSIHGSENWGNRFLGIYFKDEPGGKLVDKVTSTLGSTQISSNRDVSIRLYNNDTGSSSIDFFYHQAKLTCIRHCGVISRPLYPSLLDWNPMRIIRYPCTLMFFLQLRVTISMVQLSIQQQKTMNQMVPYWNQKHTSINQTAVYTIEKATT